MSVRDAITPEQRERLAPAEPRLRGVADGLAGWVDDDDPADAWADRLRLLGNGVVPAQAAAAFVELVRRTDTNAGRNGEVKP